MPSPDHCSRKIPLVGLIKGPTDMIDCPYLSRVIIVNGENVFSITYDDLKKGGEPIQLIKNKVE